MNPFQLEVKKSQEVRKVPGSNKIEITQFMTEVIAYGNAAVKAISIILLLIILPQFLIS
jgi:hypothetical protein